MTQVLSTPSWLFSELIGVANISTASVVGIRAQSELEPWIGGLGAEFG